jgi:hypothetical protein
MKIPATDDTDLLERQVAHLRDRVDLWLTEADRRRHALVRAINVPRQVRLHPGVALAIAGALVAAGISSVVLAVRRGRRHRKLTVRARGLYQALGRMLKRPDRVAEKPPHLAKKLLTAILTTAATSLVRKQVERLVVAPRYALPPIR